MCFFFFSNVLVLRSVYIRYILPEERPKNVTVFFFSFKVGAVSGHLLYELMAFLILRCSQPSHQPLKTLAFVNHSLLTNFSSRICILLFFFPPPFFPTYLNNWDSVHGSFADKRGFVVWGCFYLSCKEADRAEGSAAVAAVHGLLPWAPLLPWSNPW